MICRAFLDTNVLFGGLSANILLTLAEKPYELYRPYWSDYVLGELRRTLVPSMERHYPADEVDERIERRIGFMTSAFPHALVTGWRRKLRVVSGLVEDSGDAPILAGALRSHANYLITDNLKDFRTDDIEDVFGVTVLRPDDFADILYQVDRDTFRSAMIAMTKDNHRPPRNLQELTETLNEQERWKGLAKTIRLDATRRASKSLAPPIYGTQPRDALGRYSFKSSWDGDLDEADYGIWGRDGNGYV